VSTNIAVISDLHGLWPRFEKAKKLLDEGIKKFLVAGDIAALGYPEAQQANVRQNFEFLLEGGRGVEVFVIPGNDPNVLNYLIMNIKERVIERNKI
jgi:Icc-related predicted phosphoesterase